MITSVLSLSIFFATLNERLNELMVKPLVNLAPGSKFASLTTPYLAMLTGVLLAIAFQIDIITPLVAALELAIPSPWPGLIVTGLLIGAGSNFLHDIWPSS